MASYAWTCTAVLQQLCYGSCVKLYCIHAPSMFEKPASLGGAIGIGYDFPDGHGADVNLIYTVY